MARGFFGFGEAGEEKIDDSNYTWDESDESSSSESNNSVDTVKSEVTIYKEGTYGEIESEYEETYIYRPDGSIDTLDSE